MRGFGTFRAEFGCVDDLLLRIQSEEIIFLTDRVDFTRLPLFGFLFLQSAFAFVGLLIDLTRLGRILRKPNPCVSTFLEEEDAERRQQKNPDQALIQLQAGNLVGESESQFRIFCFYYILHFESS